MSKNTVPITIDKTLFNVHPKVRHFILQQSQMIEQLRIVLKESGEKLDEAYKKGLKDGAGSGGGFNMTEHLPPE